MAPFRFAVQLSNASSGASWRDLARTIEGLGYSTLFIPDHFEDQFGPLVALTVAAEATSALKVGSLVFGNDYRHPIVLAKEIATLDLMSEGRVEFGLGAGWMTTDYEQSGIPNDPPGVRISRMAESLAVMKSLWSTGAATFAGEHYTIAGAVGAPLPHSRPYPKVIIGGGGKRVLGIAAREADIVGVNPSLAAGHVGAEVLATTTAEYYDQRIDWVREAAGDRFDDLELNALIGFAIVTDDAAGLAAQMAPAFGIDPADALHVPVALAGTLEEMADELRWRREEYGISYWSIESDAWKTLGPMVSELAGK